MPGHRDRADPPMLATTPPSDGVVLDTNVFIDALAGRGPAALRSLLADLPRSFVSAVTVAELSWTGGRLDPRHPGTAAVVATIEGALARIDPVKILTPDADQWRTAGERAGAAWRAIAGGVRDPRGAADRHELMHDALTAAVASAAGLTVITADRDFELLMRLDPALKVVFYDRT